MAALISYSEARAVVAEAVIPVEKQVLPLASCIDHVLGQDLIAEEDVPPFDRSAFDGYALRSEDSRSASYDTPITLRILEEIRASCIGQQEIISGTASKIMTGAPVPEGADAVVPFEHTSASSDSIIIFSPVAAGKNIVRRGEDVRKGALLSRKGIRIDAGLIGSLAGQNISDPIVYRKPRIGLLSIGDELLDPGEKPASGKIYDTNRFSLGAAVHRIGAVPVFYHCVGDRIDAVGYAIENCLAECDAVITTGGVSVGDFDLTPDAIKAIGSDFLFQKVDLKPGKACAYATCHGKLICALSGNPVSALTNFYTVALPALRKLCGLTDYSTHEFPVILCDPFEKQSPVTRVLHGYLDLNCGTVSFRFPKAQGNAMISGMAGCNAAAIIPANSGPVPSGTVLSGFLLNE